MFSHFSSIYRHFALICKQIFSKTYECVALETILWYNAARGLLNLVQCGPPPCLSLRPLL
jgi:hypothetical protein